jgi:DtxR family Mn-dependent transcriptional regulator
MGADRSPERARQDYVKVIYQLSQLAPVRAAELARHLGVSRASVSKFKRMLAQEQLLERSRGRNDSLRLTKKGMGLALRMVRRHRLVETFLYTTLRMPLDRVHSEAERIEHAISDDVSVRLARFLDYPVADPHGHRIPNGTAQHGTLQEAALTSIVPRQDIVVTSIGDQRAATVRRLASLGVLPGLRATVASKDAAGIRLVAKGRHIALSIEAASDVRCVLAPARRSMK